MQVVHISAECYPIAKAGGLGDVAGALPRYLNDIDSLEAKLIMPWVNNKWTQSHQFEEAYSSHLIFGNHELRVQFLKTSELGFDVYLTKIQGFDYRENVYGYSDDAYYFVAFQIAVSNWLKDWEVKPDVIHCHDYHTGLIPFFIKYAPDYYSLKDIPTVFTIHNGQYQGQMSWNLTHVLPDFDHKYLPILRWRNILNPMATAIKCAWKVTTVSPQYMIELMSDSNGLEELFIAEQSKCGGIINGIDTDEWDPSKDKYLIENYEASSLDKGKKANKAYICEMFNFDPSLPLFAFIGRLVDQKGVDILVESIHYALNFHDFPMNFLIVGSGDKKYEKGVEYLQQHTDNRMSSYIGYDEGLARKVYAASDFMVVPSRFEPCGLNQMYALRYGAVPIVRTVGGLINTIVDINDEGGNGFRFIQLNANDILHAFYRAKDLYSSKEALTKQMQYNMKLDFSWKKSAQQYLQLYKNLF